MKRALALLVFWPMLAHADGAFPDSLQLFVPAERPDEILLATNFGLLVTEDGGAHWSWVCEQAIATGARLYQRGPAGRLYAAAPLALVSSSDTCTWTAAAGAIAGGYVMDAFPDPNDAMRVLAIGTPASDGYVPPVLWQSSDGGVTFAPPSYTAPSGFVLSGVEVPRGQPQMVYLTAFEYVSNQPQPYLLTSVDGGVTFTPTDLSGALGMAAVRLIAVDPADPHKLYLRLTVASGDQLAIVDGAGARVALSLPSSMAAFLRRADGRIFTGTKDAIGFVSNDGGQTFAPWPGAPHLRALAERGGRLYASGDDLADHFAVAVSDDDGAHWQPRLTFNHICGPLDCEPVADACTGPWLTLEATFQIQPNVCSGAGGSGGQGDGGCGCEVGAAGGTSAGLLALALAAVVSIRSLRRRSRSRSGRTDRAGHAAPARAARGAPDPRS